MIEKVLGGELRNPATEPPGVPGQVLLLTRAVERREAEVLEKARA